MLLNHIGSGFELHHVSPTLFFLTEFIGKLTFPIMAYLLVEGFHYTKNVRNYAFRLAIFWIISIYPFHLWFYPETSFGVTELVNNIFFTLLMGLLLIYWYDRTKNSFIHVLLVILFTLFTIMSDWNLIGILIIFGFYRISNPAAKKIIPPIYGAFLMFALLFLVWLASPAALPLYEVFTALGILCVIPLLLNYNGQRGYSPNWVKWGFYLFYPLHLIVLLLIRSLM